MIRMNQAHKEQIEKIIEAMECSKNDDVPTVVGGFDSYSIFHSLCYL